VPQALILRAFLIVTPGGSPGDGTGLNAYGAQEWPIFIQRKLPDCFQRQPCCPGRPSPGLPQVTPRVTTKKVLLKKGCKAHIRAPVQWQSPISVLYSTESGSALACVKTASGATHCNTHTFWIYSKKSKNDSLRVRLHCT